MGKLLKGIRQKPFMKFTVPKVSSLNLHYLAKLMTWEGNLIKTYEVKIKIAHTSYFNNFNVKFHKINHLFFGFFLFFRQTTA